MVNFNKYGGGTWLVAWSKHTKKSVQGQFEKKPPQTTLDHYRLIDCVTNLLVTVALLEEIAL